ncbi:erythromycin esterase family protein [Streptomyces sp. NPDC047002]|uniref:erythromycin esterase family protein n=1 Tax=Streptomyces sp. NPDC047002 TaxID=3155475 RepID=UPI0034512502
MDARPVSAPAERRGAGEGILSGRGGSPARAAAAVADGGLPALAGPVAELVDELAAGARVLGWSEGVHLRREYLVARNAVLRHLLGHHRVAAVAAESHFGRSRAADAYALGAGPEEPPRAAVGGVWSWAQSAALADNRALLRLLRRHNAGRAPAERVRFYGLEMYGSGAAEPADGGPVAEEPADPGDARHAAWLRRRLAEHRAAGGDHRDLAGRDAAQYATLCEVARRHPEGLILLFEQVEHLDPRVPHALGARLARGGLGVCRTVGAVWRDGDPSVAYPLGRYRDLSRRIAERAAAGGPGLLAAPGGTALLDLRPWRTARPASPDGRAPGTGEPPRDAVFADAAAAFDAVLYAPSLTPAARIAPS